MKKYLITVNGKQYEVTVEEIKEEPQSSFKKPLTGTIPNPTPMPKITPTPTPQNPTPGTAGNNAITAPMPGKILSIKVKPGDQVKRGQVLLILEAMKMENEILSPRDATIKEIKVAEGASVDTGTPLINLA